MAAQMSWESELIRSLEDRDRREKTDGEFYAAFDAVLQRLQKSELTVRTLTVTDANREHQRLLDENSVYERDLAEQKSKVQALEDNVSMLQRKVRNLANEKEKLNVVVTRLTNKLNSQTEEYQHKNKSIELLNDEFLSMQIQNNLLHDRLATLEKENDQLVQRWLAKAQEDADKINALLEG